MVIENVFNAHGFDRIVAFTGADITESMIDECLAIDREFYEDEFSWEQSDIKSVVKSFGQFCFVFFDKDDKKVMGYSFWFPIKTQVFFDFIKNQKMLLLLKKEYCTGFKGNESINLFCGGEAFVKGYNIRELHGAIEDLFQKRVLDLANVGVKVKYIALEACCKYDEQFLVPLLGLEKSVKKENSTFYYGEYSPNTVFKNSKISQELKKIYH